MDLKTSESSTLSHVLLKHVSEPVPTSVFSCKHKYSETSFKLNLQGMETCLSYNFGSPVDLQFNFHNTS